MTKLSWPKARYRKASDDNVYSLPRPQYARQDWIDAKLKRQINALTQRIENGKGWLKQIPTTDPRWPRWKQKLDQLILVRKDLRAGTAKSAEWLARQEQKHQ